MEEKLCQACNGRGELQCAGCNGSGKETEREADASVKEFAIKSWVSCSRCHGKGTITCPACRGSGKVKE